MPSIFQFAALPGSLLTGLVAGGAIAATARRYSFRRSHVSRFVGNTANAAAGSSVRRIPLPASVANLTPDDEPALGLANEFVDRLGDVTLLQWLEVGHRLVTHQETLAARSTSWAIMDATIADRGLALAAWHVRDAVETIAYLASYPAARLSRRDRRLFAAAHAAAEDAALAVLVREQLPTEDFAALCAPFTAFVERTVS